MNRVVLGALWSHWRRNPIQLFTLLAGLALATALWSGVQAINAEARASYDAAAATLGEGQFDQLLRRDGQPISQETYVALRRAGWLVSPVTEGRLNGVRVIGLDPLTAPQGIGPITVTDGADIGAFLAGAGQVFGNQDALDALAGLGPEGVLATEVAPMTVLTDIGVAQVLLGAEGDISRLIVARAQPVGQVPLSDVAPDLVRQVAQGGSDIARLTDSFHLNLTAFGLLSFAVGIFIVNGAIGLAFEQRRPVVRTLRALGVPLPRLIALMALELLVLALLAGAIGVALGYLVAAVLLPNVAITLASLYGATVAGAITLRPIWWLSGLAIAVGGTGLAAAAAFWGLARMPLLAGANPRALTMAAGRRAMWQGLGAVILLLAAMLLALTGQGLIAGFAFLACLLVGGALALPPLLDVILRAGQRRARTARSEWFWADTRQQLPGLSLALMALLLAMAANTGVSTMVSSFRLTFIGFLDQRLVSELYVNAESEEQARAIQTYLDPQVEVVLPIIWADTTVAGLPTEVFGAIDHRTYRENWKFLTEGEAPWDRVAAGQAILINEQLARRSGLDIGDTVMVAGRSLEVAATYGDYGNPIGQAIINKDVFDALFPGITPVRFGVRTDADAVPDLVAGLEADLGLPPTAMINQAGIKAFSLGVFERTFTVTAALNVLTLSVAAFAILMSLLTLATMRVPQLAPAWAMGLTRRSLGRAEMVRAILLAGLTAVLALPLGLVLAWALLSIVNVAAFGWKLPMYLFPGDYARLTLFALLAAALAALWPAWRLARTPPAALLKVFSNER